MSTRLEKLMFTIGLIDKTTGPTNKVLANLDKVHKRAQSGIQKIATGAAGLFATGFLLSSLMSPAIAMDKALGEVASLGVADASLKQLNATALKFSADYGESAAEFVSASYDIQSAINGLNSNELSRFTESSAILAKATKSDAATITDYMGTMYGIFQNEAKAIGKTQWVEQLTGQTATAVQMFKTTGSEMASAFTSLGAEATTSGVAMAEQIAIMGTLQATMSGSEAGTKYRSFLAGVGKAQDKLGLSFTDSQGQMLPMLDILEKIRGKFGAIDTVAESDLLMKAFGKKEAVGLIKLLMQDMDGLGTSMASLQKVTGMDKAVGMAQKQIDPWERTGAAINALGIAFGQVLQPALTPVLDMLSNAAATITRWTQLFPNLTRYVGYATLAVMGIVAAVSLFALFGGIATLVTAGWAAAGAILALAFSPITLIILAIGVAIGALVYYWDDIQLAFSQGVNYLLAQFEKIPAYFKQLKNWFSGLDLFSFLDLGVLDKLTGLLGFGNDTAEQEKAQLKAALPTLTADASAQVSNGGIKKQLSTTFNNQRAVGDVTIHTTQKPDGFFIHDELAMAAL